MVTNIAIKTIKYVNIFKALKNIWDPVKAIKVLIVTMSSTKEVLLLKYPYLNYLAINTKVIYDHMYFHKSNSR